MDIRAARAHVLIFVALLSPLTLSAQFKDPTQEELRMTTEPKAPGAAAVYLYVEDIADQHDTSRSYYQRIKVLTEKGKEMATVNVSYDPDIEKIPEIEARTIHADGTVIPMTEKPSNLVTVKTRDLELHKLVFTLPNVEVGSILEYRMKEKFKSFVDAPTWMVQQDTFVHCAHYEFRSLASWTMSYVSQLGAGAKVVKDKHDTYTLDVSDVPPVPDEDWMPPLNTLKWRVLFFNSSYSSKTAFWEAAGKQWADTLREVTKPTGALKKAAESLVAPGDSETAKARKIYAAAMQMQNTDFTRQRTEVERKKEKIKEAQTVEDLWKLKEGSGDELTLLFVTLCRAVGLNVEPMRVTNRARAVFDENLMSTEQLDDYVAVAQLDGKEVFLDPGQKMCPFGMLYWGHMITSGMRYAAKSAVIGRMPQPDYRATLVSRVVDLTLDESGGVQGSIRVVLSGQEALHWRQIALRNDESEVRKQFNEWVHGTLPEGVQGEFDHFLALDDYESNLVATVRISGTLGTGTAKRTFLPGQFFEANAKHPFVSEEKRAMPVDLYYAYAKSDEVVYHLPTGFVVQSAPQAQSIQWPGHAALKIDSDTAAGTVTVKRVLGIGLAILAPGDYAGLHDFYQKVAAADQQQIVLARAVASK
jgi:hypothetical protein